MKKSCLLILILALSAIGTAQSKTITLEAKVGTEREEFNGLLLDHGISANVGVIFFHGRGQDPNGDVVRQLRQHLHDEGYTTLSIDNPVPPSGGTSFSNYLANESNIEPRVFAYFNAAVDYLKTKNFNIDTIVLGGFSLGSRFATATAAAWESGLVEVRNDVELGGLFGVGMYVGIGSTPTTTSANINVYDTRRNLALISSIPVLDLYGDLDSKAADFASTRVFFFRC